MPWGITGWCARKPRRTGLSDDVWVATWTLHADPPWEGHYTSSTWVISWKSLVCPFIMDVPSCWKTASLQGSHIWPDHPLIGVARVLCSHRVSEERRIQELGRVSLGSGKAQKTQPFFWLLVCKHLEIPQRVYNISCSECDTKENERSRELLSKTSCNFT